jgi:hypothetical protein
LRYARRPRGLSYAGNERRNNRRRRAARRSCTRPIDASHPLVRIVAAQATQAIRHVRTRSWYEYDTDHKNIS